MLPFRIFHLLKMLISHFLLIVAQHSLFPWKILDLFFSSEHVDVIVTFGVLQIRVFLL